MENTASSVPQLRPTRLPRGLLIGLTACLGLPAGAQDDRTWQGGGANTLWSTSANWSEGSPPHVDADGTITLRTTDTSRLGVGYKTGDLTFGSTGHTIKLDGQMLETASIRFDTVNSPHGIIAGPGTIRLGSASAPANIQLADRRSSRFDVGAGVTLGGHIGTISGRNATGIDSWIDLRGAVIENGTLDINAIEMGERTFINMDNTTAIDRFRIHNALRIHGRRGRWIGDPADTAYRRLPTNLVVIVGSTESPAILDLGIRSADSYFDMGPVHFNASTGGSFTGRLSRLRVAHSTHGGTGPNVSTMDLAGMDGCDIVTTTFSVGTSDFDYSSNPSEAGPVRGTVKLPPGKVQAGTLTVGRDAPRDAVNAAELEFHGTHVAITHAATVRQSGRVTININGSASGLELTADATLAVDGEIHLAFTTEPDWPYVPHYGMRWDGDQTAALQALVDADSITFDAAALERPVEVYEYRDVTYVGIAPIPIGSILLLP